MTPEVLDELERLAKAALDPPWHSGHNDAPEPEYIVCESRNSSAVAFVRYAKDARLIAALRNNADALIREAREAARLRDRLHTTLADEAETDTAIRTAAKRVLPESFVDGDGYCTPLEDIAETLVSEAARLREERKRFLGVLARLKCATSIPSLPGVNLGDMRSSMTRTYVRAIAEAEALIEEMEEESKGGA